MFALTRERSVVWNRQSLFFFTHVSKTPLLMGCCSTVSRQLPREIQGKPSMRPSSQEPPFTSRAPRVIDRPPTARGERVDGARGIWRYAGAIYKGSAIALIPWIIGLVIVQPGTGYAYHLDWAGRGIVALLAGGALTTGVLCTLRSHQAAVAAMFMATVAFVTVWFSDLALIHQKKTLIIAWLVFAPLTFVTVWVAARVVRSCDSQWRMPRWVGRAYFAFAAQSVLCTVGFILVAPIVYGDRFSSAVEARRLRTSWTGLDLFELAALLVTAYLIRRGSPWLVVSATVVAGLLCCDAWVNVITSTGTDQALGIALAFIELPLAMYSLVLAIREARSWEKRAAQIAESDVSF